jgi:hypothetical protein
MGTRNRRLDRKVLDQQAINALLLSRLELDWPPMQAGLETHATAVQRQALYRLMATKIPELGAFPIWRRMCSGELALQPGDDRHLVELKQILPDSQVLIEAIENPGTSSKILARVMKENPGKTIRFFSQMALGIRRK